MNINCRRSSSIDNLPIFEEIYKQNYPLNVNNPLTLHQQSKNQISAYPLHQVYFKKKVQAWRDDWHKRLVLLSHYNTKFQPTSQNP